MTSRNLTDVLQGLYASEINCGLTSFWDAGWEAWIGDEMNGLRAEGICLDLSAIAGWLHDNAVRLYPESAYAKAHA